MISIGAVYGGPEHQHFGIRYSIDSLMEATTDVCGDFESGLYPAVNVVFYLSGSINTLNWEGLRDGRFSRKEQMVMVQVAVPQEVADSDDPKPFLIDSLREANKIAFEAFRKRKMNYPLEDAQAMVDQIDAAYTAAETD